MFKRRIKVTFYLKSGQLFTMKFQEFEISKLSGTKGSREMDFKNPSSSFTVDLNEIEAVIIKNVLF